MKSEDITSGLDLLGDWLDAKGYTEEAGLCTKAMDEINRLREARDECERQYQEQVNKVGDVLEERNILRAENERLRAALANSELPCVYCSLSKEEWSKCSSGFPGCDRADDAMGCPELGAAIKLEALRAENARLLEALKPFADLYNPEENVYLDMRLDAGFNPGIVVPMKYLRAARAAMGCEND